MRLLAAALVLSVTVAVVAVVFALWPVVADAPWEDTPVARQQAEPNTDAIRCEAALSLRETTVQKGILHSREGSGLPETEYRRQLANAALEIRKYC